MHSVPLQLELLNKDHDRKQFDCGEVSLNEWLQRMALQQQEKNYARTRVIVDSESPKRILGYYALLPAQVDTSQFPPGRKLPRRLPCLLLGRLAVDRSTQGRRIGELLLVDAIERTYRSIAEVGGAGLYADALNERAAAFYDRYGFQALGDDPLRLFLAVRWP
jgi:GNAT superfamily N-acetyltransferase